MNKPRLVLLGLPAIFAVALLTVAFTRAESDAAAPAFTDANSRVLQPATPDASPSPSPTAPPAPSTPEPTPESPPEPTPGEEPPPTELPTPEPTPASSPSATPTARPVHSGPATVINRGVTTRRAVALTFDAGADRGYAEAILDVLLQQGVRATFGMTGVWAQYNPDLVQRMAAEGHQLMNHSYDHTSFTGFSTGRRAQTSPQRAWQLDTTGAIIQELTGASPVPFFRSPYGDTDASVMRDIGARGYAYNVLWTVDSRGWMRYTAGQIIQRCLAQATPGAIYVMHVGAQSQDGPALNAVINGLRDMGYTFETVSEIVRP